MAKFLKFRTPIKLKVSSKNVEVNDPNTTDFVEAAGFGITGFNATLFFGHQIVICELVTPYHY